MCILSFFFFFFNYHLTILELMDAKVYIYLKKGYLNIRQTERVNFLDAILIIQLTLLVLLDTGDWLSMVGCWDRNSVTEE